MTVPIIFRVYTLMALSLSCAALHIHASEPHPTSLEPYALPEITQPSTSIPSSSNDTPSNLEGQTPFLALPLLVENEQTIIGEQHARERRRRIGRHMSGCVMSGILSGLSTVITILGATTEDFSPPVKIAWTTGYGLFALVSACYAGHSLFKCCKVCCQRNNR